MRSDSAAAGTPSSESPAVLAAIVAAGLTPHQVSLLLTQLTSLTNVGSRPTWMPAPSSLLEMCYGTGFKRTRIARELATIAPACTHVAMVLPYDSPAGSNGHYDYFRHIVTGAKTAFSRSMLTHLRRPVLVDVYTVNKDGTLQFVPPHTEWYRRLALPSHIV